MKKFLLCALLGATFSMQSQNTIEKVPQNANAVVSANGENLLELMSVVELDESLLGKSLIPMIQRFSETSTSLADAGINLNASTQYFMQVTDSITYHVVILPVSNSDKLEVFFAGMEGSEIVQEQEFHTFGGEQTAPVMLWTKEYVAFVNGVLNNDYLNKEEVAARYGLEVEEPFSLEAWLAENAEKEPEETTVYPDDTEVEEVEIESVEDVEVAEEVVIEEEVIETIPQDSTAYDYEYDYDYEYEPAEPSENDKIKKQLAAAWSFAKAKEYLRADGKSSILKNKEYRKQIDDKAELSLYMADMSAMMEAFFSGLSGYANLDATMMSDMYKEFSLSNNFYINDKDITVKMTSNFSDEMADMYKKIYDRKLNSDFLNYINEDKAIGYMAFAINTEETLKVYPKLLTKYMPNVPQLDTEVVDIFADLFSLLLDEEAIGDVVKGDALFVFNGIYEEEVTYTTYDYDEDFNYVEVTDTKMEKVPDFLVMASSDDTSLLNRLIAYGVEKHVIENMGGYYEIDTPVDVPFNVYLTIKNGIIFMGNSSESMSQITSGNFVAKVSDAHKDMLTKSKFSAYFNADRMSQELPVEDMSIGEMKMVLYLLENFGELSLETSKVKGNRMEGTYKWTIPAGHENGLKYFFDVIQNMPR
ncbi:hypothetical protein [Neptunitalea lumnitzerae]|uniref:DUF4836 family protein n=1 Tax=Neptunitalea lumnitzerae TaxID=2965509 RepID=A0ABQ5MF53_9FLAO|nr:hypothetical protein [Neptunitalea sp. Y10]GLB48024.1 hypothetical protein Y10_03920 [Neptunitalea sp. Y10]